MLTMAAPEAVISTNERGTLMPSSFTTFNALQVGQGIELRHLNQIHILSRGSSIAGVNSGNRAHPL
jgi:hypothetical protein